MYIMRRILIPFICLTGLVCSCNQKALEIESASSNEYVLTFSNEIDVDVESKAHTVLEPSSSGVSANIYWGASTGSLGTSETAVSGYTGNQSLLFKTSGPTTLATGKYMTNPAKTYNWYVSNINPTSGSTGWTIVADGATTSIDPVAGVASSNGTSVSITLNHILARIGTLSATAPTGCTVYSIAWTLIPVGKVNNKYLGTKGTYNIAKGQYTDISTSLAESGATITANQDTWYIPGQYKIKLVYKLKKGDWISSDITKTSSAFELAKGKTNNFSCTLDGDSATEIKLSVTLSSWGYNSVTLNF